MKKQDQNQNTKQKPGTKALSAPDGSPSPTPETYKASFGATGQRPYVPLAFSQKLERERDEARKEAEWARDLIDGWSEASGTKFSWENSPVLASEERGS